MTSPNEKHSCKEIKTLYANEKGWVSILPMEYQSVTFDSCKDLNIKYIEYGKNWCNSWPSKSLFLYGCSGSGKTTFAFACIRELMRKPIRGYFWPRYLTGKQLDNRLLASMQMDGGDEEEIKNWATIDLLFLDEIEKATVSERFKVQLFEIINRRMMNGLCTIICSNCDPEKAAAVLDTAIISRMKDPTKWDILKFPKDLRPLRTISFD